MDAPNHLARAVIVSDLLFQGGARFGHAFAFDPMPVSYVLHDIIAVGFASAFPPGLAGTLLMAIAFLSVPLAFRWFLRCWGVSKPLTQLGFLLAIFVSTHWFLLAGFTAFQVSIGAVLIGLGLMHRLLSRSFRASQYPLFILVAVVSYGLHLSSLIMLSAGALVLPTVRLYAREVSIGSVAKVLLPLIALGGYYALLGGGEIEGTVHLGAPLLKLFRLAAPFVRFDLAVDVIIFGLLGGILVSLLWYGRGSLRAASTLLALAVVYLALYFALPIASGRVYDVDVRALPYAYLMLTAAVLVATQRAGRSPPRIIWITATLLLAVNLAVMAHQLIPADRHLSEYRDGLMMVPKGARILPVMAWSEHGRLNPYSHAHAWATIDQGALSPYLFSGTYGDAMTYFTTSFAPYRPGLHWYTRDEGVPNWSRIGESYDYVVVAGPIDVGRIPLAGQWIHRSEAFSLLRLDPAFRN